MKRQFRCKSAHVTREDIKHESLVKYLANRPKSGKNGLYYYLIYPEIKFVLKASPVFSFFCEQIKYCTVMH